MLDCLKLGLYGCYQGFAVWGLCLRVVVYCFLWCSLITMLLGWFDGGWFCVCVYLD